MENTNKKIKMTPIDLENRLIEFASRIIDMVEALHKTFAAKHIGGQTIRSGTSPALNYAEAQAAESNKDFIHKMKVCLKELRETYVCIQIVEKRKWFEEKRLIPLKTENNELISIFVASIKTALNKK